MRRPRTLKLAAIASALLGALLVPATASGALKFRTLKGSVVGDQNSFVSLQVGFKNGKPKRVRGLVYRNLDTYCDPDGSLGPEAPEPVGEVSGRGGQNRGPSVEYNWTFYWVSYPNEPSRMIEMNGKLLRRFNFNRAVGTMAIHHNEGPCQTATGRFRLKK
jgi:hypothetical protein